MFLRQDWYLVFGSLSCKTLAKVFHTLFRFKMKLIAASIEIPSKQTAPKQQTLKCTLHIPLASDRLFNYSILNWFKLESVAMTKWYDKCSSFQSFILVEFRNWSGYWIAHMSKFLRMNSVSRILSLSLIACSASNSIQKYNFH